MNWKPFQLDGYAFMHTLQSLHRASQFLAMVSHAYSHHRPDDSHNSLQWNASSKTLESCWIDEATVQVKLDV